MVEFLARNDEQRLLDETVSRVFADPQSLERNLTQLGLLALPFAEVDGGLHQDESDERTDLAIAFAAKGRAYGIDTLLFQAVLGGGIAAAISTPDRADIVQGIIEGRERVAVGLHEPRARTDIYHCETQATRTANGWTIVGAKTLVFGAEGASRLIVLARIDERTEDPRAGLGLFLFNIEGPDAEWRHYRLRDGSPASDVTLTGVDVAEQALIAGPDTAPGIMDRILCLTKLCLAAEASGMMQAMLAGTATYVNERQQFGQAIGSFQVIQHRLADMAVLADQSSALVAKIAAGSADPVAIESAYRAIADMGMTAAKSAIQLHGGYGMTEDLPYGQALRRMMTIALLF